MENFSCVQCNKASVEDEFQRCHSCSLSHAELCAKLDAVPRIKREKVREELFAVKSMKGGVEFTDWYNRQEMAIFGIKLPE